MRVALVSQLMSKALRLSLSSLNEVSVGHIVTLASSDVEKFQVFGTLLCFLVLAPLEALVVLGLGLHLVGTKLHRRLRAVLALGAAADALQPSLWCHPAPGGSPQRHEGKAHLAGDHWRSAHQGAGVGACDDQPDQPCTCRRSQGCATRQHAARRQRVHLFCGAAPPRLCDLRHPCGTAPTSEREHGRGRRSCSSTQSSSRSPSFSRWGLSLARSLVAAKRLQRLLELPEGPTRFDPTTTATATAHRPQAQPMLCTTRLCSKLVRRAVLLAHSPAWASRRRLVSSS